MTSSFFKKFFSKIIFFLTNFENAPENDIFKKDIFRKDIFRKCARK